MDKLKTPQFKTALIRKIGNLYPNTEITFTERKKGIGFFLTENRSNLKSSVVEINRYHEGILKKDWLTKHIKFE